MTLLTWRPCASALHREQSAAAYALLNDLLQKADLKPTEIGRTESGRPYFCDRPELDFSLSHTKGLVVCALAIGAGEDSSPRVGVDVEAAPNEEKAARLADRFFEPSEKEYLCAAEDPSRAFAEIFTAKEAYGKYIGDGLAVHLGDDTAQDGFEKRAGIAFFRYRVGAFCITLCQREGSPPPEIVSLS